jgi:hypothetical protein
MARFAPRFLAVIATCLLSVFARADFVTYTYSTMPGTAVANPRTQTASLLSDAGPGSAVNFTGETNVLAAGNSDIVLAGLTTTSNASPKSPATFTNQYWTVDLLITDNASGKSSNFAFAGLLTGQLSSMSSTFTNTFLGMQPLTATIGSNVYTVTLASFSPPGPPTSANRGSISADVTVTPGSGQTIQGGASTPEPSTMVLAGLAVVGFVARWRRRLAALVS